jgi:HlyD family secretion protein
MFEAEYHRAPVVQKKAIVGARILKVAAKVLVPVLIAGGIAFYFLRGADSTVKYVTATVTRGSVIRSVSATGTVNPVITVQVGSYVSGPIQAIYADFNSPVKSGQLIAKIDPRLFEVKVAQTRAALDTAKAQLGKDQADLAYKKLTYERDTELLKRHVVSSDTLDSAISAYHQAEAQVALDKANIEQQQANLQEAEVNLNYTNIVSPVDGTVVSRNVDVGQTVAASFQTPTLFLIAKDLTRMQVDTNVSESDIGNVRTEQKAEFQVDAFPERKFEGVVSQVRQAPISVQNVTTYDVVVNVANPELLLKPGMTADVTIITARRDGVVRIPDQAFRFSPQGLQGPSSAAELAGGEGEAPHRARVWIPSGSGIKPVSLLTGLDDGSYVEMVDGQLHPGDLVVVDEIRPAQTQSSHTLHFPH